MTNIVQFPLKTKKKITYRPAINVDARDGVGLATNAPVFKKTLSFLWNFVRLPLFFVMYWLRLPVMAVCKLVSVGSLLGWLVALVVIPNDTHRVWGMAIISLSFFIIEWTYDYFLMMLSPQEMIKTL